MKAANDTTWQNARALVVVAKPAIAGEVKTRLCPPLTSLQARALYECLLKDVVAKMGKYSDADLWVAFAPNGEEYFRRHFAGTVRLIAQRGRDLGERLHHVFVDLFHRGYREIVITDSDSPTVPLSSIELAYGKLADEQCQLVLGPSMDGGYYLIGLKSPVQELFQRISWSTEAVLSQTLQRASEAELRTALLPRAYDIDVERDLHRLRSDLGKHHGLQELVPRTAVFLQSFFKEPEGPVGDTPKSPPWAKEEEIL